MITRSFSLPVTSVNRNKSVFKTIGMCLDTSLRTPTIFLLLLLATLLPDGLFAQYVDLGLPSGTKWKLSNETGGFKGQYTCYEANNSYDGKLPTKAQFEELESECRWVWDSIRKGATVIGPNGKSIFLPAKEGWTIRSHRNGMKVTLNEEKVTYGHYWINQCGYLSFNSKNHSIENSLNSSDMCFVRLVQSYVDLGLPSRTIWKTTNETSSGYELISHDKATEKFGWNKLPTKEQFEELISECNWTWNSKLNNGYTVTGPNGNHIFLPYYTSSGLTAGDYWSSTSSNSGDAWFLSLSGLEVRDNENKKNKYSVRLISDRYDSDLYSYYEAEQKDKNESGSSERSGQDVAYVDLGLPSGTKWRATAETGGTNGFYTYDEAMEAFGDKLPIQEQLEELKDKCKWESDWKRKGYIVRGPNGNSIFLPYLGSNGCAGDVDNRSYCNYWSSTSKSPDMAFGLFYGMTDLAHYGVYPYKRCRGFSVCLVNDGVDFFIGKKLNEEAHKAWEMHDTSKAVQLWKEAANKNYAEAQFHLGLCYHNGYGVEKSYTKAAEWYKKAAQQGNAEAQFHLGSCYYEGDGVDKSYTNAVEWYTKAAEQGVAEAQFHLGSCYHNGEGVEKSYLSAAKWYEKAARQGVAKAQFHLGSCYYEGEGLDKSYTNAVEWYTKAAEQGDAEAQFHLGLCYYEGKGVEESEMKAEEWLKKAVSQGGTVANLATEKLSEIEMQYVDLGLPSGTKWKTTNETCSTGDFYTYNEAVSIFGNRLPSEEQWQELKKCKWKWDRKRKGYTVQGPNGNSIFLPAAGFFSSTSSSRVAENEWGEYLSSTERWGTTIYFLFFNSHRHKVTTAFKDFKDFPYKLSVRLVKNR